MACKKNIRCLLKEKYPASLFNKKIELSQITLSPDYLHKTTALSQNSIISIFSYVKTTTPSQGVIIDGLVIGADTRYNFYTFYSNIVDYNSYKFILCDKNVYEVVGTPLNIDLLNYIIQFSAVLKGSENKAFAYNSSAKFS